MDIRPVPNYELFTTLSAAKSREAGNYELANQNENNP